jgi:hypothetical protein
MVHVGSESLMRHVQLLLSRGGMLHATHGKMYIGSKTCTSDSLALSKHVSLHSMLQKTVLEQNKKRVGLEAWICFVYIKFRVPFLYPYNSIRKTH